jgi:hypothetical protein
VIAATIGSAPAPWSIVEHDDPREPFGEIRGRREQQHTAEQVAVQDRVTEIQPAEQADPVSRRGWP